MACPDPKKQRVDVRMSHDELLAKAKEGLAKVCAAAEMPESHGVGHALRVLGHAEKALAAPGAAIPEPRALAVRFAALLHDVDDKKYFKETQPGTYPNAQSIMQECGVDGELVKLALRMIDLVSCSKNGNSCPDDAKASPELLWPRWADRLEATGEIGVVRCYQYNQENAVPCSACGSSLKPACYVCQGTGKEGKAPMCCADTPRPKNEQQMWEFATPERFQQYQVGTAKGVSKSMMDHYYDKLLRVACPPYEIVKNSYFEKEMAGGAQPLVDICMSYSETGKVPLADIEAMESKFQN